MNAACVRRANPMPDGEPQSKIRDPLRYLLTLGLGFDRILAAGKAPLRRVRVRRKGTGVMGKQEFYMARVVDGINVVAFRQSHILDAVAIDRMAASLRELVDAAPDRRFVFDFDQVTFMSSSALRMLIELHHRIGQGQARMKLAGLSEELMEPFRMTKLDTWFDIYKTVDAAIEAHRKNM